jgi:hypothetical protein
VSLLHVLVLSGILEPQLTRDEIDDEDRAAFVKGPS